MIREGSPEDVPLIRQLAERTWWPSYREILSAEQIRYMLQELYSQPALLRQMEHGHRFLLLQEAGQALGFASWSLLVDPKKSRLHKLYVVPEAQGKGAGRRLLEEVESHARDRACDSLELNVNRFNKARYFYQKLGFEIVGAEDIPIGPFFMNDYIMRKRLDVPR